MTEMTLFRVATGIAASAWSYAADGQFECAHLAYAIADDLLPLGRFDADLSLLRHRRGAPAKNGGIVETVAPTEDMVITLYCEDSVQESQTGDGMEPATINGQNLERNIRAFLDTFDPGFHRGNVERMTDNVPGDLPHVLVMSTGRCGTVSLYRLLGNSRLIPYHTYWWTGAVTGRWEAMCRLISGQFDNVDPVFQDWLSMRAAEWLGAAAQNQPMIGLNHWDTIFAPAFAAVHSEARFVYLCRDPMAVFESFYGKNQWAGNQLAPIDYAFDPGFRFHRPDHGLITDIAWYIRFTEEFCRAMGRVMGGRFIEVQAEDLFTQKRDEIGRLLDFIGAGIPLDDAVVHFGTKINEKAHKAQFSPDEMKPAREEFKEAYCRFS